MPVTQFGRLVRASVADVRSFTDEDGVSVDYRELKKDEFRRGPQWTTAVKVGSAMCDGELVTQNWHPASDDPWSARARSLSGQYSPSPARITPTLTQPDGLVDFVATDYAAGAFPGTLSNVELNQDNELVLSSGQLTGIYTTGELDLGSTDDWWLSHKIHVLANDYRWRIGQAIGELSGVTIGDLIGTPAARGIGSAYFSDRDMAGIRIHNPQVTWLLEVTVYDETGVPGTFQEFTPGWYRGRYAQFKLTLTREVGADLAVSDATNAEPIVITTTTDHGMRTGQRVRVRNVGGNTAANGAWAITVVDGDEFSLDGSVGNGVYTSGGVVVKDIDLRVTEFEIAKSRSHGQRLFDIRNYGAIPNINTAAQAALNTAAINAAIVDCANLAGSEPYGGIVYFPRGNWYVDDQIVIKNRVWLVGDNSFATQISAHSTFPTSTAMVRIGDGTSKVFNARLWRIALRCGSIAGSIGVYSNECEEQSGIFDCDISGFEDCAIRIEAGSSMFSARSLYLIADADGANYAIHCNGSNGHAKIEDVTCGLASGTNYYTDAIRIEAGVVSLDHIHMEAADHGIRVMTGATANLRTISGHSSIGSDAGGQNDGAVIRIDSGAQVNGFDLWSGSPGADTLVWDYNRGSPLESSTSYMNFYASHILYVGSVGIYDNLAQTANVICYIRNLAGVNDYFVFETLQQTLNNKSFTEPIIRHSGQTTDQDVTLDNVNQQIAGNILQIPNLGDDGVSPGTGPATCEILVNTRQDAASGLLLWQETRSLRLVDLEIKRNGQLTPFAYLTSADQTGAGGARIPDLGDAAVHDIAIVDLGQTYSGDNIFTSGPKLKTAGSFTVQLLNTAETAARTATIPLLGGNRTFAMIDIAQTFSGIPTFSSGVQGELFILSTDQSDRIRLFHNNTDPFFKWTDGDLTLSTDEGTNTDTRVYVKGKGTGKGNLFVFDQDNAEYLNLHADSGYVIVSAGGVSPASLSIQHDAATNINMFEFCASGVTRELFIHGFRSGDANRALAIGVGVDAADQASFDGVSNYWFDGNVIVNNFLNWSNAEAIPLVSAGTHTPTASPAHWFELVTGTMYLCLEYSGTTYELAMTAR